MRVSRAPCVRYLVMTSRTCARLPVPPYRLSGWGGRRASGYGSVLVIFLGGKSRGSAHVFLLGNHISDEQRDKEQESRRKAKEHETRGDKI